MIEITKHSWNGSTMKERASGGKKTNPSFLSLSLSSIPHPLCPLWRVLLSLFSRGARENGPELTRDRGHEDSPAFTRCNSADSSEIGARASD